METSKNTSKLPNWRWDGLSTMGAIAGIVLGWICASLFANPSPIG